MFNIINKDCIEENLHKVFESNFSVQSHDVCGSIVHEYHTNAFMPHLIKLFDKYDISYTYSTAENNLIEFTYVDYYYRDVPDSEKKHNDFEEEKFHILLEKEDRNLLFSGKITGITYGDAETYPVLAGIDFIYSYFCFPSKQINIVSAILRDTWGRDDRIMTLPGDNTIAYFVVKEDVYLHKRSENFMSYLIKCKLLGCNVPLIEVTDRDAKFEFRNEIRDEDIYYFYYRTDIKIAPRSSWEANIARVFKHLGIHFDYEKTSFRRYDINTGQQTGYYFPDFFLPNNTILEVKGFWDADSRKKALEFIKHYTEYKYYVIDQDMYISIVRKYQPIIGEWEIDDVRVTQQQLQVVGLFFGERKKTYGTLQIGQKVLLKRDIDNRFDKNEIIAYTIDMREIGFISADWSCIYAPKIDIGMTFEAIISSIEPKVITLSVKRNNEDVNIMFDFLT
ncbi:MAG TPA: HIRAN domain-containing protein [Anaerovoracaceae bacterium]|nr:HIRAN domain-containing protein [Anaerovoracaceae bacterium]